ncbi:MAG: hypothetical protein RLZZ628_2997, partial [Bacteroidota bacterium]
MLRNNLFSIISLVLGMICTQLGFAQNAPTLVKDINAGVASSTPRDFFNSDNGVYFTADDATGAALFKTDGTVTTRVAYTPPAGMIFAGATWMNGQRYVLLFNNSSSFQRILLGKTDFTTTTIIDTLTNVLI